MIIDKFVKVRWSGTNRKYYEELGYTGFGRGIEFNVKVEHLNKHSCVKVNVKCEKCGNIKNVIFKSHKGICVKCSSQMNIKIAMEVAHELLKTPERKKQLSQSMKIRRSEGWGGTKIIYDEGTREKRRTNIKAKIWRKEVYERDNYTCKCCGKVGRKLNAHHIFNWADFPKKRYELSNGITLCAKCHNLFHSLYGKKANTDCQMLEFIQNINLEVSV
jgi:hypothetical protein